MRLPKMSLKKRLPCWSMAGPSSKQVRAAMVVPPSAASRPVGAGVRVRSVCSALVDRSCSILGFRVRFSVFSKSSDVLTEH
jgi:hypothetical protein